MANDKTPADTPERTIPRRRFIRDSAIAAGGTAAGIAEVTSASAKPLRFYQVPSGSPAASPVARAGAATPTTVNVNGQPLTKHEIAILSAAVDRLIPSSDKGPGAAEAGVQTYILGFLGDYGADSLPLYQAGLKALDAAAGSDGFAQARIQVQDKILTQAEKGELADAPDGFFAALLNHTRQGMFSDPIYGGNSNFAGWDLLQYPGIKLGWSVKDQAMDTVVKPEHISVAKYGGTPIE